MRSFVAIPMPAAARVALEQLQDVLSVGRKTDPAKLHLTLAFLGDQPGAMLAAVDEALSGLVWRGFDLTLAGTGGFGGHQPRVLWAGAKVTSALTVLRPKVRRVVSGAGVDLPRERFRPHVTLARLPKRLRAAETAKVASALIHSGGFTAGPFQVDRIALYRSTLCRDGAIYDVLAEYCAR